MRTTMMLATIAGLIATTAAPAADRECPFLSQIVGQCEPNDTAGRSQTPGTSEPETPSTPNEPSTPGKAGANNGHGNGDQSAPGNSGDHNNAENSSHSGQGNSSGGQGKGGRK